MKEHIIECYRNQKLVLKVECCIREDVFIEQLKNGFIYYDTGINSGNFEIINLNNFDRIVLVNEQYYSTISGSDKE